MTPQQFREYAVMQLSPTEPLFRLVTNEQKDWKPTESSFTAAQLMYHIAYALQFNANGIAKNEWELPSLRHVFVANRKTPNVSVEECIAFYQETSEQFLNIYNTMTEEEFQTATVDSTQLGKVQKWKISLFALDHHLNHKAELFMYLKMMGIPVNSKDLYGTIYLAN